MLDNKLNRGPEDASRINAYEDYELRHWSDKFDCTHNELKAAVKVVGVIARDVEAHLKKQK